MTPRVSSITAKIVRGFWADETSRDQTAPAEPFMMLQVGGCQRDAMLSGSSSHSDYHSYRNLFAPNLINLNHLKKTQDSKAISNPGCHARPANDAKVHERAVVTAAFYVLLFYVVTL